MNDGDEKGMIRPSKIYQQLTVALILHKENVLYCIRYTEDTMYK